MSKFANSGTTIGLFIEWTDNPYQIDGLVCGKDVSTPLTNVSLKKFIDYHLGIAIAGQADKQHQNTEYRRKIEEQ